MPKVTVWGGVTPRVAPVVIFDHFVVSSSNHRWWQLAGGAKDLLNAVAFNHTALKDGIFAASVLHIPESGVLSLFETG
jgi:hypothetical protein